MNEGGEEEEVEVRTNGVKVSHIFPRLLNCRASGLLKSVALLKLRVLTKFKELGASNERFNK